VADRKPADRPGSRIEDRGSPGDTGGHSPLELGERQTRSLQSTRT
jgi:hypothetical protein